MVPTLFERIRGEPAVLIVVFSSTVNSHLLAANSIGHVHIPMAPLGRCESLPAAGPSRRSRDPCARIRLRDRAHAHCRVGAVVVPSRTRLGVSTGPDLSG
jgi:hypothetical protein